MSAGNRGADHGGTGRDHLAALFFSPFAGGSHGIYIPGAFDLHLGSEDLIDRLVHHHEAQHVLLTETTAWGSALSVISQLPDWAGLFTALLDRCRITHESYATYLSCSIVSAGGASPAAVLAAYPQYAALHEQAERYLAPIRGDQRRGLAMTALARACMQTPILTELIEPWPEMITMASIRVADIPDERFHQMLRNSGGFPLPVLTEADAAVMAGFGPDPLTADAESDPVALDDRFDAAWACWEDTVYAGLARALTEIGATVVGDNDHVAKGANLIELARQVRPELSISAIADPKVAEQRMVSSVLHHARLWLSRSRQPARVVTVPDDVEVAEAVRVADATTRVGGRPNFVLHARLPARLLAGYQLPTPDRAVLAGLDQPVLISRTIADDGTDTLADVVWLTRWRRPAEVTALAAQWASRGELTCCIAASCLADANWGPAWVPVLSAVAPIIWLLDVPIRAVAPELGAARILHGIYLDLDLTLTGAKRAVAFKVPGQLGAWLALADEVGVQLITQEVAELPGVDLRMTGADWTGATEALRLVLLDLQRTESHLDLRALSDYRG
ncbi:MAG TPA: hypothetical protein VFQ44_30245 [Streptosporangiaceae bacterium]|nr:hypothetical protein [Streptosporangiaceae bacterium]